MTSNDTLKLPLHVRRRSLQLSIGTQTESQSVHGKADYTRGDRHRTNRAAIVTIAENRGDNEVNPFTVISSFKDSIPPIFLTKIKSFETE
jgi:hypothetical protein